MLVDNYPDLSDILDPELFNPSDFVLDSSDYFDSFGLNLSSYPDQPYLQSPISPPSPFLIDNDTNALGIDPQLVDTPSAVTDHGDEDDSDLDELSSSTSLPPSTTVQKQTITIPPPSSTPSSSTASKQPTTAHKSRKGTVLSGGIAKKSSSTHTKEKENTALALVSSGVAAAKKTAATRHARNASVASSSLSSLSPFGLQSIPEVPKPSLSSFSATSILAKKAFSDDGENDDELPQDWRPSPEVLAKMTSKEKRQLRNKISARNFRIRRKEYISTLEGDIAERDRLLDHFRSQLGTRESENLALRQEIAALKKTLLDGRALDPSAFSPDGASAMVLEDGVNVGINLPPPKMLPEQSAAEALMLAENAPAATVNTTMTGLLTPNTQKDLPTSRVGSSNPSGFWGGVGMGAGGMGGITPVHTTLVPDVSMVLRRALMENINPSLNQTQQSNTPAQQQGAKLLNGFDGFADANPFTLKTLDAYRMHLWGKMAAQQSHNHHLPSPSSSRTASPSPPSSPHYYNGGHLYSGGLGERLRPLFFSSSSGSSLSGKHSGSSAHFTPPGSPVFVQKSIGSSQVQKDKENARQHQQALLAAMASQTILKKLGNAFWDAFVGSPSPSSSTAVAHTSTNNNWDSDKVKRVLEGKAVLRVVDVDSLALPASSPSVVMSSVGASEKACEKRVCELLEESMRSLTIGKKS